MSAHIPRFPARPLTRALLATTLVGLALGPVSGASSSTPAGASAKPRYVSLGAVGLTVRSASLKSRTLRVKVTARRTLALRFAIVRNGKQLGSAKIRVRRGTTSLKLLLNKKSRGKNLRLRVTARAGRTRGRQRVGVALVKLPKTEPKPTPTPTVPVTPPPAAGQGTPPAPGPAPAPPAPPPAPANQAPTGLALSGSTVAENAPAGSTVGNLAGTDPDPADTLTYGFASGPGDADNARFALSDGTLRTTGPFDFEARSSFSVRLAVSDGRGGVLEQAFTITVTDVNEAPTAIALAPASLAENGGAGALVGSLSATDQDTGDTATYSLVSGPGDADNATFTISGSALRTTSDLDFEATSSYSVRVRVVDSGGLAFERTFTITVTDVNEAPTDLDLSSTSVPENAGPNALVGSLSTVDPDAGDSHAYSLVSGAGDADNAAFTVSGSALRAATSLDFETKSAYSVRLRTTDTGGLTREEPFTITVTDVNDPPVLTGSGGTLTYTENDPASVVDGALVVSDQDDTNLEGATVAISAGHQTADALGFVDTASITGSYDAGTGVLVLTGTATLAEYQAALRSITFTHSGDDPLTAKTVSFTADDGDDTSAPVSRAIALTAVNDAPTLTTTATALPYPELSGPLAADPGLTLTDPDSAQIGSATVQITANFVPSQDELAFADQLGITGSYDDATGTLTLTGVATAADYQAALRAVTYENDSSNPAPPARTLSFRATDADGATSAAATRDVSIGAANDAATITTTPTALPYTENSAPVTIDGGLTVSDVDDTNLEGAQVTVSAGFESGDTLTFINQSGITGIFNSATGVLTLTGTATVAAYQTALRSITFSSTDDDPLLTKSIAFRADDGDGLGPAATRNIAVTPVNDGPLVTTTPGNLAYTEGDGPVAVDAGLTLSDPDSTQISGATVTVAADLQPTQDVLALPMTTGITGAYNAATGVLTLTGTTTVAAYQAALRTVTYENTSEGPSPATRTIRVQATDDGGATGNLADRGVALTAVNDLPTAVDDTGTTDEDTALVTAVPGVLANDTDPDPGDTKTVVALNGSATLTGATTEGGTVTITAAGGYTYTPPAAFQALSTGESDTDTFTYAMADSAGAQSTATVTITVDGVSDAPTAVADSFDAVGNTGLFVGTSRGTAAGRQITGSVLTNDTDPDTPTANLVAEPVTNAPTTLGGTITIEADGNFTYHPDDGDTGVTDTFTYRVCDASPCNSGTTANATGTLSLPIADQVWYVDNSAAASGDGTSDGPFDTLIEAETASGPGDTTYVFDGDDTSTGLDTGYAMAASERLLGERATLSIGAENLRAGVPANRPTLTASGEDVVVLGSGATVRGLAIDPSGSGGGIAGGSGVSGGTIDDIVVEDTGTPGTQPGVELDGTTGTFSVSDLSVTTTGATGVRVNNAGTVVFTPGSAITVSTAAAKGVDLAATNLATSGFDAIQVTSSPVGAVRLANTTGAVGLGDGAGVDLSLTTTGSATPALQLTDAGTVTVPSGGTASIAAQGGPAIATSATSTTLLFDSVSSTNSATDGIDLDGPGPSIFTAPAGTLSGAAGIAFDVNGGSGDISYGGAVGDGPGASAEITGRTGGAVTLSGAITDGSDAGGGIVISGNTGGSTAFTNATTVLNTGASTAVSASGNGAHSITFSGGSLDIDTTTGAGLTATTGGTIAVTGSGNTIDRTAAGAAALTVANANIGAAGLTFQRIAANGGANGIVLNATGGSGGLTVTGTGTAGTGGTIQNTTGDAISLTSTRSTSLTRMQISGNLGNGIRGHGVTGFVLSDSVVDDNGDDGAADEAGLHLTNLSGTAAITRTVVANSIEDNARIVNASGTLSQLDVTDSTFRDTETVSPGNNGLLLQADGGSITADVLGSTFLRNRANGLQVVTNGSGTMNVEVDDSVGTQSTFDDNNIGVNIAHNSSGGMTFAVRDVAIDGRNVPAGTGGSASPVNLNLGGAATSTMSGTVSGTTITNSNSSTGPGIRTVGNGAATMTVLLDANNISQVANRGIEVLARDGSNRINATITNNVVALTDPLSLDAIRMDAGAISTDTTTVCADVRGNTASTVNGVGAFGARTRQRFLGTTFLLEGYGGAATNATAAAAHLDATNTLSPAASADLGGSGFGTIADCPTP